MINQASTDQLEEAIDDFEENWSSESRGAIADLLENYGLGGDPYALTELIRIDIELRHKRGLRTDLNDYFEPFGQLLEHPDCVAQIAFEDYRSRDTNGHLVQRSRWQHLPGIKSEAWFQQLADSEPPAAAVSHISARSLPDTDPAFQEALHENGFRLIHEIGHGAFSRVYLATQQELAGRFVVLKVVNQPLAEPQSMAMLQHTNIVPIFSFHRILSQSVICMPYAGSVTLEDFLKNNDRRDLRGGESLVVTVHDRIDQTTVTSKQDGPDTDRRPLSLIPAADEQAVLKPLDQVRSLNCNELAVWLFSRLASALAHSHARGVLHGDIKPGNVLIRNDGEPALLDFNLSQTLHRPSARHAGGTLPYMAPESLRALMGQSVAPDNSSDLYGLGVMLFEFVTGRLPYPAPRSMAPIDLQPAIDTRRAEPGWQEGDSVSPGLRSIINRMLRFAPQERYASAEEVQQDLVCEQQDVGLVHASEPRRSRLRKWMRRHPRFISSGSVGAMLLALLIPLAWSAMSWRNHSAKMSASARFEAFSDESAAVLSTVMVDPRRHEGQGVTEAIQPLEKYGVLDGSGLAAFQSPQMSAEERRLQRDTLLRHVVQVAFTETDRLRPDFKRGPLREDQLQQLDQLIAAADGIRGDDVSRACAFLHAERARLFGDSERATSLRSRAEQLPISSDNESYMEAVRLMSARQWKPALELLTVLADRNSIPSSLRWTMVGRSQYNAGQAEEAKLSITQSIERAPNASRLWFMRGLCYASLNRYARAESDFTRTLQLEPSFVPAWNHRGVARLNQRKHEQAIADFTDGLKRSPSNGQLLLNRYNAYIELGMTEQAEQDLAAVLQSTDQTASSLHSRARAIYKEAPEQALADLQRALELDPELIPALTLQALIYSSGLGDTEKAITMLDSAIEIDPKYETAVINRAVLLSKVGRYGEALRDIESAMRPPNFARSFYQAACASALMPEEHHHRRALSFLAKAMQAGFRPKELASDPDLDAIREMEGFRAIRRANHLANLIRFPHNPVDDTTAKQSAPAP